MHAAVHAPRLAAAPSRARRQVEKERYRTPEEVMEGPPNGFELEDTPNSNSLMLARSFNGACSKGVGWGMGRVGWGLGMGGSRRCCGRCAEAAHLPPSQR